MRTRMIGLFGVALVLLGTLAVSAQEVAPTKASSVCVLPFAAGEGVPADLGYRFWAGVMDQLAAQPELALNRDGALVRAALAQKKACSEMREGDIPGVAKAVGVDWVVTGTLVADTDGTVTAVGTAFRTADGGATSTPRYRIGAGEREKAIREVAAYLVRFVSTAPAAPVPVRVASVDGAVATFAAALESLTRQRFAAGLGEVLAGGHADEGVASLVESVSLFLDRSTGALPLPAIEDILRGCLILRPGYVGAVVELGRIHLLRGVESDATAAFAWAVQLASGSAAVHDLCAHAYLECNRPDKAREHVQLGLTANPRDASLNNTLGLIHLRTGRAAEAEAAFRAAIALDPTGEAGTRARSNLAVLLMSPPRSDVDAALAVLDEAIAVTPEDADLHYNRGYALHVKAQKANDPTLYAAATAAYEEALRIDPAHARAHCNLGVVLKSQGDTAGAIRHYEQALAANGGFVTAAKNLARAHEELGDKTAAVAAWRRVLEMPSASQAEKAEAEGRIRELGG